MEKILVTGTNGLLGQHLVALLLQAGYAVVGVARGANRLPDALAQRITYYNADISNDYLIHPIFEREMPAIIVHAAAIAQVDDCQLNQENCEAINVRATAQLLLSAEAYSKHFIFISTDFVFDGEKGNYTETDIPNPVNWYGFTKVQAEAIVETSSIPFTIVRTCLLYGNSLSATRSNIVTWVRDSLLNGKTIQVVDDQWRTPTYVTDLTKGLLLVIQQKATGVFHISGKDKVTPYQIALQTALLCKLDASLIEKADAGRFSQPARRPPKTGFDISKARNELGFEPISFSEGLRAMLK